MTFLGDIIVPKENESDAVFDVKKTQDSDKNTPKDILVLEVEATTVIPDGKHEGVISDVIHRDEPFGYIDVVIIEKKTQAHLKAGFPDKLTDRTSLGKFLIRMGVKVEVGKKVSLNSELLLKQVVFLTENEENEKGVFARIIRGTIKPLI